MLITKLLPKLKEDLVRATAALPTTYQAVTDSDPEAKLQSPIDYDSPTSIDLASTVNISFDCSNTNVSSQTKRSFFHSLVHDLEVRGISVPPGMSHGSILAAQTSLLGIMKLESKISRGWKQRLNSFPIMQPMLHTSQRMPVHVRCIWRCGSC